jgi:hypothetical protein
MLEAVKCRTLAPRHPARCRTAKLYVLGRVSDVIGDLDPDNGCPGVPEAYWASHIVGQWPRAGLVPRCDRAAACTAVSLLAHWLLASAIREGAEVDRDLAEAVLAGLGRRALESTDRAGCLEQVDSVLRRGAPASASLPLMALCDVAVEQLAGSVNQRWSLVIAMMIGDGLLGGAG